MFSEKFVVCTGYVFPRCAQPLSPGADAPTVGIAQLATSADLGVLWLTIENLVLSIAMSVSAESRPSDDLGTNRTTHAVPNDAVCGGR